MTIVAPAVSEEPYAMSLCLSQDCQQPVAIRDQKYWSPGVKSDETRFGVREQEPFPNFVGLDNTAARDDASSSRAEPFRGWIDRPVLGRFQFHFGPFISRMETLLGIHYSR